MEIDEKKTLVGFVVVVSILMLVLGAIGMMISFMFMFSSNALDVAGGGLCFIAGSIMMASGLVSLAVVSLKAKGKRSDSEH
jgi:small neutral amino acid transporter SnatA (MarC family)